MSEQNIEQKIWEICGVLKGAGLHISQYIEQLTLLLFLKMLDEQQRIPFLARAPLPQDAHWSALKRNSGMKLVPSLDRALEALEANKAYGEVFAGARNHVRRPAYLERAIAAIDAETWSALDVDVKGRAYESVLSRYAAEAQGAGQYFTPRSAIRTMVKAIDPRMGDTVHDPAAGTGGFLIAAYEHILAHNSGGARLSKQQKEFLRTKAFSGVELVAQTRRLGLMNLMLHGIEPDDFAIDDSILGNRSSQRYDVVMANPPYGGVPTTPRGTFPVSTRTPELCFLMHIEEILKRDGRAAVIVPDGVLFQSGAAADVREFLLTHCDVHTVLHLPNGAFVPYAGVTTNILFFNKGGKTKEVWFYDLRTGIEPRTKKSRPLTDDLFADFVVMQPKRQVGERCWQTPVEAIAEHDWNLIAPRYNPNAGDGGQEHEAPAVIADRLLKGLAEAQEAVAAVRKLVTKGV